MMLILSRIAARWPSFPRSRILPARWTHGRSQLRPRRLGVHAVLGLRQRSFGTCQLRVAHASRMLVSASRRNTLFLSVSKREARVAPLKTRSVALRQCDALKGTDDIVRAFLGKKAFVIAGAKIPVRPFVIVVAIKAPNPADHDKTAYSVVPIVADEVKT